MLLLILVFVLPGSAAFAWLLANDWRRASEDAFARANLLATRTAHQLAGEMRERETVIARFAERPLVRALDPGRCDPLIAEFVGVNPQFTGLDVRDANANVVCAYRPNAPPAAQVAHRPWFQRALRSAGFTVSGAFTGSRSGRWVSVMSHPIRDDAGKTAGLILLAIDLQELQQRVIGTVPEGALVAVADSDGNIVLRSQDAKDWLSKPAQVLAEASSRPLVAAEGVDGVRRLYAHAVVPGRDWIVAAGIIETEVFAARRALLVRGVGVGLAVLALMLLLAWRIAHAVVAPVHALAGAAARVSRGERGARASLAGPAEIGDVARQFNHMLDVRDRVDDEREQAERALRERERFVSALMGNLPGMVYRRLNDEQKTLSFVSAGCKALTGYERAELEHQPERGLARLVLAEDREDLWRVRAAALAARAAFSNEYRIVAKDGTVRWVWDHVAGVYTEDGTLQFVEGFMLDITERRHAEAALAQSQDRYRTIVETALDAVVQMDGAGHITGWNARAEQMFGWPAAQAIGRGLHDMLIPLRLREAHCRGLAHFLATGEGPMLGRLTEIEALHRDGREFPIELSVTARQGKGGYEFSAFVRDISARRRAEAERSALEAQLREAQKMEAIGTLTGGIAHDFNNILGSILGNVVLAHDRLGHGHAAHEVLEQVHRAALRARSLVQQLMTYSRRQPQQLVNRRLAPLVHETVAMLRAILPAGIALDVAVDDASLHALCDASQLQQVLVNLCSNAWQAMRGRSGRVTLGLAPVSFGEDAKSRPRGLAAGAYAHLWVSDDGSGMDEATRAHIFEPFYTTKAIGQGTGLGLAVVLGIVTAHGGSIIVDSEPGCGSTFHVYLPRVAAGADDEADMSITLEAPLGGGERVLYIDDDELMLLMVERLLTRAGYRVTAQSDARAAVAALREQPGSFDIVVSDFNMPEFSGLDVARELAALGNGLPVVISSGYVDAALREQAREAGVRAVLNKENTFEELAPLVRLVLNDDAPRP